MKVVHQGQQWVVTKIESYEEALQKYRKYKQVVFVGSDLGSSMWSRYESAGWEVFSAEPISGQTIYTISVDPGGGVDAVYDANDEEKDPESLFGEEWPQILTSLKEPLEINEIRKTFKKLLGGRK